VETHVIEFRFAEAEVAESECEMLAVRVQLREELGGVAVGGEELDDGFEVDGECLEIVESPLGLNPQHDFAERDQTRITAAFMLRRHMPTSKTTVTPGNNRPRT
jgi:hypothetical protein